MDITISELISSLERIRNKHGDVPIEFYSEEWTEDLEEKAYQQRWLQEVCESANAVHIRIASW